MGTERLTRTGTGELHVQIDHPDRRPTTTRLTIGIDATVPPRGGRALEPDDADTIGLRPE